MAIKQIHFGGLTSSTDDYGCPDGDMQVLHNVVNNGAGLRPVQHIQQLPDIASYDLPGDAKFAALAFVHKTSAGNKYIAIGSDKNAYYYDNPADNLAYNDEITDVFDSDGDIGNTTDDFNVSGEYQKQTLRLTEASTVFLLMRKGFRLYHNFIYDDSNTGLITSDDSVVFAATGETYLINGYIYEEYKSEKQAKANVTYAAYQLPTGAAEYFPIFYYLGDSVPEESTWTNMANGTTASLNKNTDSGEGSGDTGEIVVSDFTALPAAQEFSFIVPQQQNYYLLIRDGFTLARNSLYISLGFFVSYENGGIVKTGRTVLIGDVLYNEWVTQMQLEVNTWHGYQMPTKQDSYSAVYVLAAGAASAPARSRRRAPGEPQDDSLWVRLPAILDGMFVKGEFQITNVGNILAVSLNGKKNIQNNGIHYFRFTDNEYKHVVFNNPPDVAFDFRLLFSPLLGDLLGNDGGFDYMSGEVNTEGMAALDSVMTKLKKASRFVMPFFVCYAYRMYDGSFIMQSSPVLMVPSDGYIGITRPLIGGTADNQNEYSYVKIYHRPTVLQVRACISEEQLTLLQSMHEIVQSVCVFVTPQIYNFSETGDLRAITSDNKKELLGKGTFSETALYTPRPAETYDTAPGDSDIKYFPPKRAGEVKDWIESASNFYLMKEFSITEISKLRNGFMSIILDETTGILNIETNERLENGYHPRSIYIPKLMNTYNNRLNIANVQMYEELAFPISFLSCNVTSGKIDGVKSQSKISVVVYIEENGSVVRTQAVTTDMMGTIESMPGWFFYPNPSAKYAHIHEEVYQNNAKVATRNYYLPLQAHPFLHGSYYFEGYYGFKKASNAIPDLIRNFKASLIVAQSNYIYTSVVNNPFSFDAKGVNAVGNGSILSIATATKAMSEGTSFGTVPLYAFCTDGIWALSVGDEGFFAAKQPVSREVPFGSDNVLAIDNSILFLNERGLMQVSGGNTKLLSGSLTNRFPTFKLSDLPHWAEIHKTLDALAAMPTTSHDFLAFIAGGARLAFDYVNYRVYVFKDSGYLSYVYDIGSGAWSTCDCTFASSIAGFPNSYVNFNTEEGNVRVGMFSAAGNSPVGSGRVYYVTRPLKLDAPDILKTVRTLFERGINTSLENKEIALYGSRDMKHWFLIREVNKSIRIGEISGTPYKYFIVAGWSTLADGDVLSKLDIESVSRMENQMR